MFLYMLYYAVKEAEGQTRHVAKLKNLSVAGSVYQDVHKTVHLSFNSEYTVLLRESMKSQKLMVSRVMLMSGIAQGYVARWWPHVPF